MANGKILREGIFEDLWIQPAASDAGGALGAALFAWHQGLDNPRVIEEGADGLAGSYLGPAFNSDEIEAWLKRDGIPYHRHEKLQVPTIAAGLIAKEMIVGWFSGRMEFGPRALGSRSILGDARSPRTQSVMNLKIKYRESFRPFAPSCLLEDARAMFELDRVSPYMMLVASVRPERRSPVPPEQEGLFGIDKLNVPRSEVPAVTHVDYSARIHTVDRGQHPQFYKLIEEFKRKTGCGMVVNTSFNVRGEPIVCTPQDAFACFMRTEMDALFLEDCLLLKEEQAPLKEQGDWRDQYALD